MFGQYKLARVNQGIGYFACVHVQVEQSSSKYQVIDAIETIDKNQCEVNSETHPHWVYLAILGAEEAIEKLKYNDKPTNYIVKITKLVGTEIDTTDDCIITAAAIATWNAINPNNHTAEPEFDTRWKVKYPEKS
jgi:hypothetical protein